MDEIIEIPAKGKAAPKPEKQGHLIYMASGAIYDKRVGRIVSNPGGGKHAITRERALEFKELKLQRKREAVQNAANRVAEAGGSVDGKPMSGEAAFIEAITESITIKALTPNDPKAVDAARWVFHEAGVSETKAQGDDPAAGDNVTLNVIIAQYFATLSSEQEVLLHDTIEGEIQE